ncbi:hypothetical protein O181_095707, partial [Austropuccinia psidii MF-1]|nr:hypothetical protein [Austropuccinia psidii MF-1]
EIICTMQIYHGEDSGTVEYIQKLVHRKNRIPVLPSDSIEFVVVNTQKKTSILFVDKRTGDPVEEKLGLMKPFSTFSKMRSVEAVPLLSPWRLHPNIGDTQERLPSTQFQFLLALPPHPTAPSGRKVHIPLKEMKSKYSNIFSNIFYLFKDLISRLK